LPGVNASVRGKDPFFFVESPSLEIFQTCRDKVLYSLLWVTLLGQGVGLGDPQRSLPTPTMLGFCDSVTPEHWERALALERGALGKSFKKNKLKKKKKPKQKKPTKKTNKTGVCLTN